MINYDFDTDDEFIDQLDDFDSRDFWKPTRRASNDYLDDMWGRWGFGGDQSVTREKDVLIAHGMVQSFINAFARDGRYEIIFDPNMNTAGTDLQTRRVLLTPAPILDKEITPQEAGRILTGLAVHEISHPRYGKDTHNAVRRAFGNSAAANRISNLLDDVRIEQRYVEDYPGYANVFEPTLAYVSRGLVARNGGKLLKPSMKDQLNLMTGAIRYEDSIDWSDPKHAAERDWWKAWADRNATHDSPKRHVEAVREALRHIVTIKIELDLEAEAGKSGPSEKSDDQRQGDGAGESDQEASDTDDESTDEDGQGADSGDDEKIDADGGGSASDAPEEMPSRDDIGDQVESELSDKDLGVAGDEGQTTPMSQQLPTCAGTKTVESAAENAGVDETDIDVARDEAQTAIEQAKFYEDDGMGGKIDVARSLTGLPISSPRQGYRTYFERSEEASRYIRDALISSRTGHESVARYQKRGSLDQRSLHRIAARDYRLFGRRIAESPGRYNVWMMLDRSGSMNGMDSVHAAEVATAIADASRHVPTMRAAVWAWSDAFRVSGYTGRPGVALAWRSGQDTSSISKTIDLKAGGTPDAEVLSWAWRSIVKESRRGETPVIMMCSDGWGSDNMDQVVAEARQHGVIVVSVAFGNIGEKEQLRRFGNGNFVPWAGSIVATARPLAKMIARIVGRDRRR